MVLEEVKYILHWLEGESCPPRLSTANPSSTEYLEVNKQIPQIWGTWQITQVSEVWAEVFKTLREEQPLI